MIGVGKTTGFRLIAEGRLAAFKVGRKTLVEVASIDRLIATAPRAGSVDKLAA
ncbi:MAG: helix-turn-helix domain-containing protein [Proteobacteria bacterium]|nr:helix-turn-helix domain-containing protein [Pseudomonadota bacterium]